MIDRRAAIAGLLSLSACAAVADAPPRAPLPRTRPLGPIPEATSEAGFELKARLGPSGPSGWLVADLDTGAVLDAQDGERAFAPASVAKMPTALYAAERLGLAHRFETAVLGRGRLAAGTLDGDLILKGGGDPELDSDALYTLAEALRSAGLTRITGRFLVDGAPLPEIASIDPTQPIDVPYNPGVAGLNLNFNRVRLRWGRGQPRFSALGEGRDPAAPWIGVDPARGRPMHVVAGERVLWRLPARALQGRGERWLPVKRPVLHAGRVFQAIAREVGIVLPSPELGLAGEARVLARLSGRPLGEVASDMLRFSTNLTAEALGLAASHATDGAPATLAASAGLMNRWHAGCIGRSSDDAAIGFVNHSGLSIQSRIAPEHLVALLASAAGRGAAKARAPSLPPGTAAALLAPYALGGRDNPLAAATEVRAKTGTMDYVRGLSGYLTTPGGRRLAFAILSNDLAARRGAVRQLNRAWMRRAKGFERALLLSWAGRFDRA
ncbi:MAG: D-alanyl-D-alanine carboxypeptidase [Pseudomonadota bacterium]